MGEDEQQRDEGRPTSSSDAPQHRLWDGSPVKTVLSPMAVAAVSQTVPLGAVLPQMSGLLDQMNKINQGTARAFFPMLANREVAASWARPFSVISQQQQDRMLTAISPIAAAAFIGHAPSRFVPSAFKETAERLEKSNKRIVRTVFPALSIAEKAAPQVPSIPAIKHRLWDGSPVKTVLSPMTVSAVSQTVPLGAVLPQMSGLLDQMNKINQGTARACFPMLANREVAASWARPFSVISQQQQDRMLAAISPIAAAALTGHAPFRFVPPAFKEAMEQLEKISQGAVGLNFAASLGLDRVLGFRGADLDAVSQAPAGNMLVNAPAFSPERQRAAFRLTVWLLTVAAVAAGAIELSLIHDVFAALLECALPAGDRAEVQARRLWDHLH